MPPAAVPGPEAGSTSWDPAQYARFAGPRARPFHDLLARVGAQDPGLVVDLGCGNGPRTLDLSARWPRADVVGVDHSPEMLAAARRADADGRVSWVEGDLASWDPESAGAPEVLVSNASLQWVPDHLTLLERWVGALAPGGWFAMQVPANFDAPTHRLMREVAADHPRRDELLPALARPAVAEPGTYLTLLTRLGCEVDVWETTYHHVLDPAGEQASPVLEWVRATGLRPVLRVLTGPGEQEAFVAAYDALLRQAYPRGEVGVVLPFHRLFAVAHRTGGGAD